MTRTVVAILDRDDWQANTDIIVIADSARRRLTWVPRDLWSPRLNDRINAAFYMGGCAELLAALAELGFACEGALCLRRSAAEKVLSAVDVTVPVESRLEFWYPLQPTLPIEEGRKMIVFEPPEARLRGERVHQWIGARKKVGGGLSDLDRLERQQALLKVLLRGGFDFRGALREPELFQSAGEHPLEPLKHVDATWRMSTFRRVFDSRMGSKAVLVRASGAQYLRFRIRRRIKWALAKLGPGRSAAGDRGDTSSAAPSPDAIAWGARVSPLFRARLIEICGGLQLDPNALMAIIAFETARSFSPSALNKLSGATGLIQFTPDTAATLGTTTEALAAMSDVEQLAFVERYLQPYAGRIGDLPDAYMAVLWPEAIGEPLSRVLFSSPSGAYQRNRNLDVNEDGRITKGEAAAPILNYLEEGRRPGNLG